MMTTKTIKPRVKLMALLFFMVLGLSFLTACGRNDSPVKETVASPVVKDKGEKEESEGGTVNLSAEKQKLAGIEVRTLSLEVVSTPMSATAVIELNADRVSKVSSRATGKITRLMATQGQRVKSGQALAYLDSVELDQIWTDYRKAQGKVDLARKNFQREETLFQKKISPEKDVLKARQELGEAEADINLAQERFRMLGVDVELFATTKGNGNHPLIPVASSAGGVVIEKMVSQGEVVNPEKVLFMVADLSTLWVVIDVYEKDMSRLRVGTGVKVSVTAFPEKVFKGKISYVADIVDEKTRTEKARVTIDNASGLLKPGMFASVLVEAKNGGAEQLIAVPEEAVLIDGAARYVFVQVSPDKFKRRDIEIGRTFGKSLEVTAGIKQGETVTVKGAFILKSELKKGELEGDAH
jgi:cobalt-zinc-cadmium efflux system membrane fusion protein